MSFDLILPFLRPIAGLIQDPEISEVMVNPSGAVFVERNGEMNQVAGVEIDKRHVEVAAKNIARLLGDDVSEDKPILDSRLPDGSRVAALFPPCSVGGVTLTIRKFSNRWFSIDELVTMGSLEPETAGILRIAVATRKNILISGGTGTGKTTLLNALAGIIPGNERIIVIEETSEVQLDKPNVVRLEARGPRADTCPITIRDLVKASLRHRPDRLIVGEVRGAEAFDLLQALNTGHAGSLSTIHANSSEQAFSRMTNCVLESGIDLPYAALRRTIASSIDFIVQTQRKEGRRMVTELVEVGGYDNDRDKFSSAVVRRAEVSEADIAMGKRITRRAGRLGGS